MLDGQLLLSGRVSTASRIALALLAGFVASVAMVLMVGVAGGMLLATRADLTGWLGVPENSLPENTRPMILVPLPR